MKFYNREEYQNENIGSFEILTPTYWGSLGAVITGTLSTIVATIRTEPPPYVIACDDEIMALTAFYASLAYVFLFTCRYYCAVCVNMYGGSSASSQWPPGAPRRFAFVALSFLVLLALSSVGAVIAVGAHLSIAICIAMAIISFIIFLVGWVLSRADQHKYGNVVSTFGLGDLVLIFMSLIVYKSVDGETNETSVVVLFILTFCLASFVLVEFRRRYFRVFRQKFRVLLNYLDQ